MKKLTFLFGLGLTVLASSLMLTGCSSEAATGELGSPVELGTKSITVTASSSSIFSKDDEGSMKSLIAPEGKLYLKVRFEHNDDSYFRSVLNGEQELEEVDYLIASDFLDKDPNIGSSAFKESLFLIDANTSALTVRLKSYSDKVVNIEVTDFSDNADRSVSEIMKQFVAEFKTGVNLLDPVKNYTSQDVFDIAFEKGNEVPLSPLTANMKITYVSKDGNYYKCTGELLGSPYPIEIWWENDEISKIWFSLK